MSEIREMGSKSAVFLINFDFKCGCYGCKCGFEFAFDKAVRYQRSCYSNSNFFRNKRVFKKV